MRAVCLDGPKQLVVKEVDMPKADGEKVLVKVSDVGICGSDIHLWEQGQRIGLIMGHEFAGTVVDAGALKDSLKVGDRVTVLPLNPCGECEPCKKGNSKGCLNALAASPGITAPGAYAEYYLARPDMVRKLPDNISEEEATLIEPAAVALRAIRMSGIKPGDKVLVAGGGVIGLLSAAFARIAGASYIALTEANPLRGANAKEMGDVDQVFDATDEQLVAKLMQASGGGFDQCIDCVGIAPAINAGIMALKKGGKMMLLGINYSPVPISGLMAVLKEIEYKGSIGYDQEFDMVMDLMNKGILKAARFISDTIDLEGVQGAFEKLSSGQYPDVKIVIKP